MLIKPKRLQPGDIVATVSASWGGAGDSEIRWRYDRAQINKNTPIRYDCELVLFK